MKIGITGAGGFVGSVLVKELVAAGHDVRGLLYNGDYPLPGVEFEKVKGDVLNPDQMNSFFEGIEVAIHTAALISIKGDPTGMVGKVNVEGPRNVVNACLKNGVKRLVHISSIHSMEAEPLDEPLDETRALVGSNAFKYDQSKANGEREVRKGLEKGLDAVIVNPTGIMGPYDSAPSPVGENLLKVHFGEIPALINGGYDFVDVRDVVKGVILAMEKGRKGEKYMLSGHYMSVKEMAGFVEKATGTPAPKVQLPNWVQWVGLPFVTLYSKLTGKKPLYTNEMITITLHGENITNAKARKELGYDPIPLEQSVKEAFEWFKENGYLNKK